MHLKEFYEVVLFAQNCIAVVRYNCKCAIMINRTKIRSLSMCNDQTDIGDFVCQEVTNKKRVPLFISLLTVAIDEINDYKKICDITGHRQGVFFCFAQSKKLSQQTMSVNKK